MSRYRKLIGMAAVVAVAGLAAGVGTTTAYADPPPPQDLPALYVSVPPEVKLPAGVEARTVRTTVHLAHVTNPKVRFDLAGLKGVAGIKFPGGCAPSGASTVTCRLPDITATKDIDLPLLVQPAKDAAAGASATVPITVAADGLGPNTNEPLKISLHDGVDLVMLEFGDKEPEFTPADTFGVAATVVNIGNKTAVGLRLSFGFDSGIVPDRHEDCTYQSTFPMVTCIVAAVVPPNHKAILGAHGFSLSPDAMGAKGVFAVIEGIQETDPAAAEVARIAKARGKKALSATVTPLAEASAAGEINPEDNGAEFRFSVKNTYDIEALGASATGKVGDVVKVTIGARNNGPGTIDIARSGGEPSWHYFFTVPPGTETVAVPQRCRGKVAGENGSFEMVPGKTGVTFYECLGEPDIFKATTTTSQEISLKITTATPNATGTVSWHNPDRDPTDPPADAKPDNDKASVVINATGGGGLPITGTNTAAIVGTGLGLLAAGAALLFIARRRRGVGVTPES